MSSRISRETLDEIKSRVDLRRVAADFTTLRKKNSDECEGPCPRCGGNDRFWVLAHRWGCRRCYYEKRGNLYTLIQVARGVSFPEAVRMGARYAGMSDYCPPTIVGPKTETKKFGQNRTPPPDAWMKKADTFTIQCQNILWSAIGLEALQWLRNRNLSDAVIVAARLGYNPTLRFEDRNEWGMEPELNEKGNLKKVGLFPGIVIPWDRFDSNSVWKVKVRSLTGGPKQRYRKVVGNWMDRLYCCHLVKDDKPVVLCESELDALTIYAHAGRQVAAVATGGTKGCKSKDNVKLLSKAPLVLVGFDNDPAGEEDSLFWLNALPNARRWRPFWGDINDMAQQGVDIQNWVQAALDQLGRC